MLRGWQWFAVLLVALGTFACQNETENKFPHLTTTYQAVLLSNGQVFFGKLESAGSKYPVLTEVHYVQAQNNPESKQVNNILIKRGKEPHAPNRMVLNSAHILVIEPVTPGSQVEKLILEQKSQR